MTKVTYRPTDDSDTITEIFGQVVEAGQSVDITDEKQLKKLKGNPEFKVAGEKAEDDGEDKRQKASDERLSKAVDGRTKEAREARQKAAEADQEAQAKERAAQQATAIAAARAEAENAE